MKLQIFNNNGFGQIRSLVLDDEVWFIGKDITMALGYSNDRKALQDNVDADDRRLIQKSPEVTLEIPNRGITAINESGLLGGNKYFFPDPDIQNISLLPEIPLLFHGYFEVL